VQLIGHKTGDVGGLRKASYQSSDSIMNWLYRGRCRP